jgi:hypothetical protein
MEGVCFWRVRDVDACPRGDTGRDRRSSSIRLEIADGLFDFAIPLVISKNNAEQIFTRISIMFFEQLFGKIHIPDADGLKQLFMLSYNVMDAVNAQGFNPESEEYSLA